MQLHFFVMRHADAIKSNYDQDFERTLTDYGRSQMESLGEKLRKVMPESTLVVVSAAARTKETAELLRLPKSFKTIYTKDLYEIEVEDFFAYVKKLDLSKRTGLLLVGHNPFVTEISSTLAGFEVKMGTADICHLTIDEDNLLEALQMPDCWSIKAVN